MQDYALWDQLAYSSLKELALYSVCLIYSLKFIIKKEYGLAHAKMKVVSIYLKHIWIKDSV